MLLQCSLLPATFLHSGENLRPEFSSSYLHLPPRLIRHLSCFCLIPLSPSFNPACLTVVSHLFRFGMVIKHLWHRRFDSQGETEAWDPWESCLLFYIISIYRRTNVLVLQEHDWPVSRQHAPSKHRSSSLYCHCRTPKRACPLHF